MNNDILTVKNLDYYYIDGGNKRDILKDVNMSFKEGVFYTILGESGSGKTTFLSLIAGLDTPKGGDIFYKGKNINDIGLNNYRKTCVSMVFQSYNLIPYMNPIDNIYTALDIAKIKSSKENILGLLNRFGIDQTKAKRKVVNLSGGEQQRVAIARAISTNTGVILADEPTGNLDSKASNEVVKLFKELSSVYHKTVIVVTHSDLVAKASDKIIRINQDTKKLEYDTIWLKKNISIY